MGERDPDFFKLHYRQWRRRMHKARVSYDLQGALLSIVIETHQMGGPPADDDYVLAGIFMTSPRKARAVMEKLKAAGLVHVEDGLVIDKTAIEDAKERSELRAIRAQAGREGGVRSGVVRRDKAKVEQGSGDFASDKSLENNETGEAKRSMCPNKSREEKSREEKKPPSPPKGGDARALFEEWWQHYPRKVAKGAARRAFAKALKQTDIESLTNSVQRFAAKVAGKDPELIPHASTWLNAERWGDEDLAPPDSGASLAKRAEAKLNVARDWLKRHETIPTWMDDAETARKLLEEGYDYDALRTAGFSLPPRGKVVNIGDEIEKVARAKAVGEH